MAILGTPDVGQLKKEVTTLNAEISAIGNDESRYAGMIRRIMPMKKRDWQEIAADERIHIKEHGALLGLVGFIHDDLSRKGLNKIGDMDKVAKDTERLSELIKKCNIHEKYLSQLKEGAEKEIKKSLGVIKFESEGTPLISPKSIDKSLIEEKKEILLIKKMIEENQKEISDLIASLNSLKETYADINSIERNKNFSELSDEIKNKFMLDQKQFDAKLKYAYNLLNKEVSEAKKDQYSLSKEDRAARAIVKIYGSFLQKQRDQARLKERRDRIKLTIRKLE